MADPSRNIMPPAQAVPAAKTDGRIEQPVSALVLDSFDFESFPKFDPNGWTEIAAATMTSPCFAWIMRDKGLGNVTPGKGSTFIEQKISEIFDMDHTQRIYEPPAHLDQLKDQELAAYAKHNFANIIDRDRMMAVAPDEEGYLFVPDGTRPVLLTAFRTGARNPNSPQFGRHWFGADRPENEGDPVPWSHWTGSGSPSRGFGGRLTNPWVECAYNKPSYTPVSYFLVPTIET